MIADIREKKVNHNRCIFLSDFQVCMGMPCYNHTFQPKRYSASMQIPLISIIYAKKHRVDKGYRRLVQNV